MLFAAPTHGQQQHRDRKVTGDGQRRDRQPPEDERQRKGAGEPVPQRGARNRADEPAETDRRRQVADVRATAVEHVERRHDDQHVQAAAHERLGDDQPDERRGARDAGDLAEALHQLAALCLTDDALTVDVQPAEQHG